MAPDRAGQRSYMIWADLLILAIVAISAVISIWRGFVREAVSLATWVLAFWLGMGFARGLADLLVNLISQPSVRMGVAFALLFFTTLLLGALVNHLAVTLVKRTGLGGTDRVLGILFGVVRGLVVVLVLVFMAALTPMPQDSWWRESLFLVYFQGAAVFVRDLLPNDVAAYFVF